MPQYPNFKGLKYFNPESKIDKWGDPSKISRELLLKLDELRTNTGNPIFVTSGFRTKGLNGITVSQHMVGKAADIVCPALSLKTLMVLAEKVGFNGLGVYPEWKWGSKTVGGLHLDVRDHKARWMGVPVPGDHGEIYIALNEENLKKWRVV